MSKYEELTKQIIELQTAEISELKTAIQAYKEMVNSLQEIVKNQEEIIHILKYGKPLSASN